MVPGVKKKFKGLSKKRLIKAAPTVAKSSNIIIPTAILLKEILYFLFVKSRQVMIKVELNAIIRLIQTPPPN